MIFTPKPFNFIRVKEMTKKYRVYIKDDENGEKRKTTDTFAEARSIIKTYIERKIGTSLSMAKAAMVKNAMEGDYFFKDISLNKHSFFIKMYHGNKLIDEINIHDYMLDWFISASVNGELDMFPEGYSDFSKMIATMMTEGIHTMGDVVNYRLIRKSLATILAGVLKKAANDEIGVHVSSVSSEDEMRHELMKARGIVSSDDDETYMPEKTVPKKDVDKIYQ